MKKRRIVLLAIGGIVLALVLIVVVVLQTPEGKASYKAGYWEETLSGTWSINEDGKVIYIIFDGDTITVDDGREMIEGTFIANDDVIKVYVSNEILELPFEAKGNLLRLQLGDESFLLEKQK
jgi:hypothetical protein